MKIVKKNNENSAYEPMRIAKAIARAGLCSRRDAEKWILAGRVKINGKRLETPAYVVSEKDHITVDGQPLPEMAELQVWRYHKPKGLVTTHKDPENRPTVFDALRSNDLDLPRLLSVGRLDINTEGLLLMTTRGDFARHLEMPSTGWLRKYRVRAKGQISQTDLDGLKKGVTVEDVKYGSIDAVLERQQGANCWLSVSLREGKNREIKKVFSSLGLDVNRLIRISYGPFLLGNLKVGELAEVKAKVLRQQLGKVKAKEFGL